LAHASGCALEVDADTIPILEEGRLLCEAFNLDPLASIASGALLISAPESRTQPILDGLNAAGLLAVRIGKVTEAAGDSRVEIRSGGAISLLPRPERDEIAKLYE
jgi:hydrogenase maturation factor